MADKVVSFELLIDVSASAKTVGDLKKSIKDLKNAALEAGETSPVGRKFLEAAGQASDRLSDMNAQVNAFKGAGEKFATVTKVVGGLAAGFQAAQGAAALFGSSGEDLQKVLVKVQAATALAQGAQALAGITDEIGAVKKIALATASGVAGAAARLFGITTAQAMAVASAGLTVVIGAVIALISYFASASAASEELAKAEEARKEKAARRAENLSVFDKKELENAQFKIELLKKQGASIADILKAENDLLDLKIKLNQAAMDATDASAEGDKKFNELSVERTKLQNQKILLNTKEYESVVALTENGAVGSIGYYNFLLGESNSKLEKLVPGSAAYNAELEKQIDLTTKLEAAQGDAYLSKLQRDGQKPPEVSVTDSVQLPPEKQSELDFNAAFLQLQLEQEIAFEDNKKEIHKKAIEERKALTKIDINEAIRLAEQSAKALQGLGDAVFANKLAKVKKGGAEEQKIYKQQFEFNKKMQLAGAVIDGAKAIVSSLSQSPVAIGPVPNPAGIASLALVAVSTAASIAKIAATKFESSGGGSTTAPTFNASAPDVNASVPALNQPTTNLTPPTTPPPTQVYVTETDIKRVGNRVNVIESRARFG